MIQSNRGYGWFCFRQKTVRAHRASWELHNGPIPNGLHVLHKIIRIVRKCEDRANAALLLRDLAGWRF